MCDDTKPNMDLTPYTRRQFAALAGAGAATGLAGAAQAQVAVTERDVTIRTADGTCDAVLFTPSGRGSWPGVLFWPDAGGLRPVKRDMGKRLAGQGYVVLVVNPYYRTDKADVMRALNQQYIHVPLLSATMSPSKGFQGIDRVALAHHQYSETYFKFSFRDFG